MGLAPEQLEGTTGRGLVTVRGVVLGAFMSFVIGIVGPYWTFYLHSSTLFLDYSVAGAMFLLAGDLDRWGTRFYRRGWPPEEMDESTDPGE